MLVFLGDAFGVGITFETCVLDFLNWQATEIKASIEAHKNLLDEVESSVEPVQQQVLPLSPFWCCVLRLTTSGIVMGRNEKVNE